MKLGILAFLLAAFVQPLCAAEKDVLYVSTQGIWPTGKDFASILAESSLVASKALIEFQDLLDDKDIEMFGFKSLAEVKATRIESPFVVYWIALKDLQSFTNNLSAGTLLRKPWKIIYPVSYEGKIRACVTLQKSASDRWTGSDFGFPGLALSLSSARSAVVESTHLAATNIFAVEIPALNSVFLAHQSDNKIILTAVYDESELRLPAGRSMPADQLLKTLVPIAQRRRNNPG
jgi:hypothetical protein